MSTLKIQRKRLSCDADELLALLRWRFARVAYHAAQDSYEINGVIQLSVAEARLVLDGAAGLEEIVAYQNCH